MAKQSSRRRKPLVKTNKVTARSDNEGPARAIHMQASDGADIAVLDNLDVLITKEDGVWIARGIQIDYVCEGVSVTEVKEKFAEGLARSVYSNIRTSGSFVSLLRYAPPETLQAYVHPYNALHRFVHGQVTRQQLREMQQPLPLGGITWIEQREKTA
jgi:hypothetical protein